jgi:tetratricopeptide (TPR) repeat protein
VQARLEAMTGRFESARSATARAATLAEGVLEVELYSHTLVAAADVELLAGDAAAAERSARAACERLEAINELGYLSSAVPTLLEALYRLDRGDEALRLSERWDPARLTAPEDVDAQAGWRSVRAKLLAHRGNAAEAERLAREAVSLASATDYVDLHADACAALGEVLRAAGRRDESDAALAEALALYEKKGNVSAAAALRALSAEPPVGV